MPEPAIYAIIFACMSVSCPVTPEMQRYDNLFVYQTREACAALVKHMQPRLPAGVSAGCVDLDRNSWFPAKTP
jgi:hypothetical protein